jgi:hypothetical protein
MPRQRLRDTLTKLHDDLATEPKLDAETAALLRDILADIEKLLGDTGDTGSESLVSRLTDATSDFENSHPRLTATVGQLADALSGMGI